MTGPFRPGGTTSSDSSPRAPSPWKVYLMVLAVVAVAWVVCASWLIPWVIRAAYDGVSASILNDRINRPEPTPGRGLPRHVVGRRPGRHHRAGRGWALSRGRGALVAPRGTTGAWVFAGPAGRRSARSVGTRGMAGTDRRDRRSCRRRGSLRDRTPPHGGHVLGRSILDGPPRRGGVTRGDRCAGGAARSDPQHGADPDRPRARPPRDPGVVQPPPLPRPRRSGVGGGGALARGGGSGHSHHGQALRRITRRRSEDHALDPGCDGGLGGRAGRPGATPSRGKRWRDCPSRRPARRTCFW